MSPVLRPYQQRLLEQLAAATDKRILIGHRHDGLSGLASPKLPR